MIDAAGLSLVLLRLAYLGVTNVFAVLRLLPMSDRDKDAEILALRHQIMVLQRQLGTQQVRFDPSDRALLAALLYRLPRDVLGRLRLLVRPETVLRWHRNLVAHRHAVASRPKRPRPTTNRTVHPRTGATPGPGEPSLGLPALPLTRRAADPGSQGRRVHGLGDAVGGRNRSRTRTGGQHLADFLRSQADALLACDFLETFTLTGTRMYVFAVIEHASRRIRILGATAHPTGSWVAQAIRNLVMDLEDTGCQARLLIRDRDGKFPKPVDAILADAGITVVLSGIQMPRMNSIMERWVQTCRRELLDRTLICSQRLLLHALREFELHYNSHRPHQGIANARPLSPLPPQITDQGKLAHLDIRRRDRLGGILHEYEHAA
jgi:putative transposase